MNNYPYVDMTRANANGAYPVYIIVKNNQGSFFVNTGLTTCGKLEGRLFPKQDKNAKAKTSVLGKYLSDIVHTDQLLTGNNWLHVSWKPLGMPRRQIRIGYYR